MCLTAIAITGLARPGAAQATASQAAVTPPAPINRTVAADTTRPQPRLVIRTHAPDSAAAGDTIRYTLQLANPEDRPATDVEVTFDLPAGARLVSATRNGRESDGRIVWPTLASLDPGRLISFSFQITAPAAEMAVEDPQTSTQDANIARIVADPVDPTAGDQAAIPIRRFQATARVSGGQNSEILAESTVSARVSPIQAAALAMSATVPGDLADLIITKTGPISVLSTDTFDYRIEYVNIGPGAAGDVVIADTLPPGVQVIDPAGGTVAGNVITWPTVAELAVGGPYVLTVRVRALACPATLRNTATILSAVEDTFPANNVSTAVTAVTCSPSSADVAITKTGPPSVFSEDTIDYSIRVENLGPVTADSVFVTDALPAGTTFLVASGGIVPSGGVLRWPVETGLAPGATLDFTVRLLAPACPDTLTNTARVRAPGDPVPGNDVSSTVTVVTGSCPESADLGILKTGPATASPGDTIVYSITVWNDGRDAATGVVVADTLPLAGRFVGASGGATEAGGVVTWPGRTMVAGDTARFEVRFEVPPCSSITNFSTVSSASPVDPDLSDNISSVTTLIAGQGSCGADVKIEKFGPVTEAAPGDTVIWTLQVSNGGPLTARAVVVTDSLPDGLTLLSADGDPALSGRLLTWPVILRMTVQDTFRYRIRQIVPDSPVATRYVNVGRVFSTSPPPDPDLVNNRSEATTGVRPAAPDIEVSKDTVGVFRRGGTGHYRIVIRNIGKDPTDGLVELTDTLPEGLTYVSGSGTGWVVAGSGRVVTASYSTPLPVGAVARLDLEVSVASSVPDTFCNLVRVSTANDNNLSNDQAEACATVEPVPPGEVALRKTSDRSEVEVGGLVTYELVVVAAGGEALRNVAVVDRLPAGFTYESGSAHVDGRLVTNPSPGGVRTLVFELGNLAPPDTVVITYTARAGPGALGGDGINRARAHHDGGSSNEVIARVRVLAGVFSDEGMIVGTVFADSLVGMSGPAGECRCLASDELQHDEPGIPGVRVLLQDGTSAITDSYGRYLFPALSPRTWVVKIDRSTLPPGVGMVRLTNRHSDDGGTVLVDLKKGELHRADFAAAWSGPAMHAEVARRMAELDSAVTSPTAMRIGLDPPGRATGLAPGIPWTRYIPLMPDAWTGPAMPATGLLSGLTGFHRSPTGESEDSMAATVMPGPAAGASDSAAAPVRAGAGPTAASSPEEGTIAIGLIEARLDFRSLSDAEIGGVGRDAFEDALRSVSFDDDDGKVRGGTRAALFYHGRAAGRYGLTLRLDSERDDRAVLFRDITPDNFYPIYGDGSASAFDARSRGRVYARVDAGDSWLSWGDFNTGRGPTGTAGTRSLGEYARTLNGAVQHYESNRLTFDAFASRDRSVQVVDVLRGEGVSGPYPLSRTDGLYNSERVELVTRHRDQPAVVLRTEVLERFVDYTIEPLAGRILFRRPVPGFDEDLNPVEIRVTYEVEGGGDRFWVVGANARFQPASGLEIGGSLVRDDNPLSRMDLASANATVKLPADIYLSGEYARTETGGTLVGDATRFELSHVSDRFQLRGFLVATDTAFRNPTSSYGAGRDELGVTGVVRLGTGTRLFTELLASEDNRTETRREGARIGLDQAFNEWLSGQVGFRYASTSVTRQANAGPVTGETNALGLRLAARLPGSRPGSVFAEVEQDVNDSDQRRAAVGADYALFDHVRLYARHEFINSLTGPWSLDPGLDRNATVLGVATQNRSGQALFSEYRVREAIDGREAQAAIGLRNAWRLNDGVRLSASFERLTPIGPGSVDATAITSAAEFTGSPQWKGSIRGEYQARDGADNVFGSLGYARRLSPEFSLLGNSVFSTLIDGGRAWTRSRIGIAYRDADDNRWNALARYEHRYDRGPDQSTGLRESTTSHIVAAHADFQPIAGSLLRAQWTSRFTTERLAGISTNGSAHLFGGRGTFDIGDRLDVGLIGRTLLSGGTGSARFGLGGEVGVRLPANLRLAAGYNVFGFREDVASLDEYTDRGAYVQLGFRFDESLWSSPPAAPSQPARCLCPDSPDLDLVLWAPSRVVAGEPFNVEMLVTNMGEPVRDSIASERIDVGASLSRAGGFLEAPPRITVKDERRRAVWEPDSLRRGADRRKLAVILADSLLALRRTSFPPLVAADSIYVEARVSPLRSEADSANNVASRSIEVVLPPRPCDPAIQECENLADLVVWITGPSRIVGDSLFVDVTTKNFGFRTARQVETRVWWAPDLEALSEDGGQARRGGYAFIELADSLEAGSGEEQWTLKLPAPREGVAMTIFVAAHSRTTTLESNYTNNFAVWKLDLWGGGIASLGLRVVGPEIAIMGDTVRYHLSADNTGGMSLDSVLLSGRIPSAAAFLSATGGVAADSLDWVVPRLDSGRSHMELIDLTCNAPIIEVGAAVALMANPSLTARDTASTVCLTSDIVARIRRSGSAVVYEGDIVPYTITLRNAGLAPARRVRLTARVPAGTRATGASGGGTVDGPLVTWPEIELLPDSTLQFTLDVTTPVGRLDEMVIQVSSMTSTPESDSTNNSHTNTSPVRPRPIVDPDSTDLRIDIAPASVSGDTVRYRITTTNAGPRGALDVTVGASWPARVQFERVSRNGTRDGPTVSLPPIAFLPPLRSIEDELVLVMPEPWDTVRIDAFVSTISPETDTLNNRDSTRAAMTIQQIEVVIPDTTVIPIPVPSPFWAPWLWPLLILLLILLAIVIVLLIIRIVIGPWPPGGGGGGGNGGGNGGGGKLDPKKARIPFFPIGGPFFRPPVPEVPNLAAACGALEVDGTRGTAYLVRPDRLVTCSHVVANRQRGERVAIQLAERLIHAVIQAVDPQMDIAILRPTQPIDDIEPLEMAPEGPAPAYWLGFGYPSGPGEPGFEFGGVMLQPAASDRFTFGSVTLSGPGLARLLLDPKTGLRGSPVIIGGRVCGHITGHIPHSDSLLRSFAGLIKAVPASRILELLNSSDDEPEAKPLRLLGNEPARPRQDWSIAPELDCCDDGSYHAAIVFRSADSEFARRLAARLEGSGFKIRLQQRDGGRLDGPANGACRNLVVHSRSWQSGSDGPADVSLPQGGTGTTVIRADETPIPPSWDTAETIDFCGREPDTGSAIRELMSLLIGKLDPDRATQTEAVLDATESAIEVVRSADGWPKRTRFAIKRWRESGLPGHAPELIGAAQLLAAGHAEEAIEVLESVPGGARAHQLLARALSAVGRINEAIEKLEALRQAGHVDSETSAPLAELYAARWRESGGKRVAYAQKAFKVASELYHRSRTLRAGVDAARLALASGDADEARILASEVRAGLTNGGGPDGDPAILGEACLLLGDVESAFNAFQAAVSAAPDAIDSIASLYRRVNDIVSHLRGDTADAAGAADTATRFAGIFYLPRVATIQRIEPAANAREQEVRAELRELIEKRDIGLAVVCPDRMPAVTLAEEVLQRGGTVHALLPRSADLFLAGIRPSLADRVNAVLHHERTTVRHADAINGSTGGAEAPATADLADAALDSALASLATRLAGERVQQPITIVGPGMEGAAASAAADHAEPGPEHVTIESVGRPVEPAAAAVAPGSAEPATASAQPAEPAAPAGVATVAPTSGQTPTAPPATPDRMRDFGDAPTDSEPVPEPGKYARRHCVAIGIDQYEHWPTLYNAVNDAMGVAKMLETQFGFNTRHLVNGDATRKRIRALILDALPKEVGEDDLLVLVFAGHGHTERLADDEEHGFLVPVDAAKDSVSDLLQMEEVAAWTEHLACRHVLYIFDSCFSGFVGMAGGVTKRGDVDEARVAISAGSAEQTVFDGGAPGGFEDHSVFTAHLLLRLTAAVEAQDDDDTVDSMRLYVDLRDKVARATKRKQTPVYGILSGHGAGEIWLTAIKPEES